MKKQINNQIKVNSYIRRKDMFFNTWNYSVQDNLFNRITSDNSLFLKYLQNYNNSFWQKEILFSIQDYKNVEKDFISSIDVDYFGTKKIQLDNQNMRLPIRTIRNFSEKQITFNDFSYILNSTFSKVNNKINYSSGGGIYPVKQIVYVKNVENLAKGFYSYNRVEQSLYELNINDDKLNDNLLIDNIEGSFSFIIIYTYNWANNSYKYGDPGMSFAFYELGSQNMLLRQNCWKKNIGLCEIGGFNKKKLEKMLNFDGYYNHIIGVTIGGGNANN